MADTELRVSLAASADRKWNKRDLASKAARGILVDCLDRRGIKHEFRQCDDDIIDEILESWASIIRHVAILDITNPRTGDPFV